MQALSLGRARTYLKHLSRTYHEQKEQEEERSAHLHDARLQLHHVKEIEEDLEINLQNLDARLGATLTEEKRIMQHQQEEQLLNDQIKTKLKIVEDHLDQYLRATHAKKAVHLHVCYHRQKEKKKRVEQEVKMRVGSPYERVKIMQENLSVIKQYVHHMKKTHPDHERVGQVEKRIHSLQRRLKQFDKKKK